MGTNVDESQGTMRVRLLVRAQTYFYLLIVPQKLASISVK